MVKGKLSAVATFGDGAGQSVTATELESEVSASADANEQARRLSVLYAKLLGLPEPSDACGLATVPEHDDHRPRPSESRGRANGGGSGGESGGSAHHPSLPGGVRAARKVDKGAGARQPAHQPTAKKAQPGHTSDRTCHRAGKAFGSPI